MTRELISSIISFVCVWTEIRATVEEIVVCFVSVSENGGRRNGDDSWQVWR
jgi:hypothetical protein